MKQFAGQNKNMSACTAASASGACFSASFFSLLMGTAASVSIFLLISLIPLLVIR